MEKAMEQVRKDHLITFTKHLPIYDLALSPKFMIQIQIHYDMNSNPKMFINKLQMLASIAISNKHKLAWFIQWNESNVLKETNKIPKQGFSNKIFFQWLHKATFWS